VRRAVLAAAALVALTGAACGSQPELGAAAAQVLQQDVADVRAAAKSGDQPRTAAALGKLRGDVAAQGAAGHLSAARAARILDAGARVALDVSAGGSAGVPTTVPVAPVISPAASPTAPAPVPKAPEHKPKGQGDGGD
jgi:hypothetical protein